MSHRTRAILSALGLALMGIGSGLVTIANAGCAATPFPSGRIKLDACSGTGCDQPPAPPTSPNPAR